MPPAPSAAKMAAEHELDLAGVAGSGKRGQVLKGDVIEALAKPPAPAPAPRLPPAPSRRRPRRPLRRCARLRARTTPRARSACG